MLLIRRRPAARRNDTIQSFERNPWPPASWTKTGSLKFLSPDSVCSFTSAGTVAVNAVFPSGTCYKKSISQEWLKAWLTYGD